MSLRKPLYMSGILAGAAALLLCVILLVGSLESTVALAAGQPECNGHPGAADPQDDGVNLCLPDDASDRATSAIDNNRGNAQATAPIPDRLSAGDLLDTNGIEFSKVLQDESTMEGHHIRVITSVDVLLGDLVNLGSGNVYRDGDDLVDATLLVMFLNRSNSVDFVFDPSDTLTITTVDAQPITIDISQAITVRRNDTPDHFENFATFWIDVNGKLYLNVRQTNELQRGPFTYEEAVLNGAQ